MPARSAPTLWPGTWLVGFPAPRSRCGAVGTFPQSAPPLSALLPPASLCTAAALASQNRELPTPVIEERRSGVVYNDMGIALMNCRHARVTMPVASCAECCAVWRSQRACIDVGLMHSLCCCLPAWAHRPSWLAIELASQQVN